ncbi:hypothetical protein GCM10007094_38350 [Pseudovibrio japonicus]|uniref:TadE-like domain-containing protein n=1 Tax=Pseudovibrio japonicus TaxID=366534 RepID=A0ABQ3EL55_9HYPH|nr:TadE/TadG family type IV pilus assembly protein [Pseudovibrio japonicus]GHB45285.1 hypothetical protein GCM10007094_38350 [Pseudovibrio japonicus]
MRAHRKLGKKILHITAHDAGAAAIEFAILLPLLLFLFVGMVELTTALSYDRRVSKTAASIADLVARAQDVSTSINDIERAIEHQMTPFEDAAVEVRVGMVLIVNQLPEVVWGWANNTTAWTQGNEPEGITFPDTMLTTGQYYLVATANFEYTPLLGSVMSNLSEHLTGDKGNFLSIPLSDSFILRPRGVSCVEYLDNCANYPPE